jgi:hypothetical protein
MKALPYLRSHFSCVVKKVMSANSELSMLSKFLFIAQECIQTALYWVCRNYVDWKHEVKWSKLYECVPISRPTDATCDRFLFSVYMCITLHVSSVKRSLSGVPHRTYSVQFLCLCLSGITNPADRHKHRNWRLYVRWGTPDDERLTLETCRVIHI